MDARDEVAARLGVPTCAECGRVAIRRFVPVAADGYVAIPVLGFETDHFVEAPFNAYAPADDRVAVCLWCRDALLLTKKKAERRVRAAERTAKRRLRKRRQARAQDERAGQLEHLPVRGLRCVS
jgi:hypothetical protein